LGTGRLAETHVAALAALRDSGGLNVDGQRVQIQPALYGRQPEKMQVLAERYGVRRVSQRLEELIEASDVDVVDNCLVNALHYQPLMHAIRHRKHVFSEKPLTIDLGEAVLLLQAARSAGVQHGVIQNMRFNAGPRKAHELLQAGYVGRIFSTDVVFGYMVPQTVLNRPTWFYKLEEAGGGVVEDMMAHFFDLLRTLVGPIGAVYAATSIAWAERREPDGTPFRVEVEDLASVTIRFENGAIGNCFASWVRGKREEVPEFQVDGEDGSLVFSFNKLRAIKHADAPLFRFDARQVQTESLEDWQAKDVEVGRDPFGLQLELWLQGIVRGTPTPGVPTWEDAVTNQRLIKAAYRSAAERREVRLEEIPTADRAAPPAEHSFAP
jgi:predicted dehydrogenase